MFHGSVFPDKSLIFEEIGIDMLSVHNFFNYNAWNRYSWGGAFRTLSNIYDWVFFAKIVIAFVS